MDSGATLNDLKVQVTNRQVLSIALPITFAILIPQLNMLINSIFLGRVSEAALGNAGITGVFYLIFAVAGNGLNNAMQSVFSKNAGSGNPENFKTILSQGIRISLQFSAGCILFTWLIAPFIMRAVSDSVSYDTEMNFLRIRIFGLPFLYLFQMGNAFLVASLNSRYLMIGFICEAAVNVIFDWLLIFGHAGFHAMGFNGAAVASLIAEFTGLAVVLAVLILSGLKQKYSLLKTFRFNGEINRQILNVSLPLITQYIISVTTWLVFFLLLEGRGPAAKAISNVMRNVFGLVGVFLWAFAATTTTMVSNLIGQKKEQDVLRAINLIMLWSIGFCTVMVTLLNIFPGSFFRLFGRDEAFVQQGIAVIRTVSAGIMLMSIANVWLNGVTGTGKTRINLGIEIVAISLYLGYTYYFMKLHYVSLAMAWSNEIIYWITIFALSYGFLKSGKWKVVNK